LISILTDLDVLSVTVIVAFPAAAGVVGVPWIDPVSVIFNPAGSPVALNTYEGVPPDTAPYRFMIVIAVPTADAGMSYAELYVNVGGLAAATVIVKYFM
jgi:hypothetical protein